MSNTKAQPAESTASAGTAWEAFWETFDRNDYPNVKAMVKAGWQARGASEYERGRREGHLEEAKVNRAKCVAFHESSIGRYFAKRVAELEALAATSGTPAPPQPTNFATIQGPITSDTFTVGPDGKSAYHISSVPTPPPAGETLPACTNQCESTAGKTVEAVTQGCRAPDLPHSTQPSGVQREGLREVLEALAKKWCKYNDSDARSDSEDSGFDEPIGTYMHGTRLGCAAELRAALAAAREPEAGKPAVRRDQALGA